MPAVETHFTDSVQLRSFS